MRCNLHVQSLSAIAAIGLCVPPAFDAAAAVTWNKIHSGFSAPVEITNAGDGTQRLFVLEQGGRLRLIKGGVIQATPFLDLGGLTSSGGERGLLGVAFHPQYATNRRFFINYTRASDGATVIARYTASAGNPDIADPASATVLLTIPQPYPNHNGGALKFGRDGFLYIGMGDGGSGNDPQGRAQDKTTLLGKILRIDVNHGNPYTIPPGNPFPTGVGGLPEIFAVGVRNPWRMSFDRATGDFWFGDVGQDAVEEIDWLPAGTGAGANFGWRVLEGNTCTGLSGPVTCTDPTLTAPAITYPHSVGCSVTGGFVYRGAAIPSLVGQYVYGDFCSGRIWAAQRNGSGVWVPTELGAATPYGVSGFGESESGELYFADYGSGDIYRFTDTAPAAAVLAVTTTSLNFGNVNVGSTSSAQTVTLSNSGGGILTLSALTAGGANPGDFSRSGTCAVGTNLTTLQTCTIIDQFVPTAAGARTANLVIASNGGSATISVSGTGVAVPLAPALTLSTVALTFGNVNVGSASPVQTITVSNSGGGTLILTALTAGGANSAEFPRTGTCTATSALPAGQNCTLVYQFVPAAVGGRTATLSIVSNAGSASATLAGTGVTAVPAPVLDVSSMELALGTVNVGSASPTQAVTLTNTGSGTLSLSALTLGGAHPADFIRGGTCSIGTNLTSTQSCTVTMLFAPAVIGARSATLAIASNGGTKVVTLSGTGATAAGALASVIEYYHAGLDHYFVSALAADIAALDSGQFKGWSRTGKNFNAFITAQPGTSPVCRFYLPPVHGDSHFFSASPDECAQVLVKFPGFTYESAAAMYEFLPDTTTGSCPANTVPLYRLWNQRVDSNHRYTIDRFIRDQMVAQGFVREGYGPEAVAMCTPI